MGISFPGWKSLKNAYRVYKTIGQIANSYGTDTFSFVTNDGRRSRISRNDLIQEYRETAYYCVNINANAVAQTPLRLYMPVREDNDMLRGKLFRAKPLKKSLQEWVATKSSLAGHRGDEVEELTTHPLIDLLRRPCVQPNGKSLLSRRDLLSVTQKYLDVTGQAFWWKERQGGKIVNIWLVPSHLIEAKGNPGSDNQIDYYEFMPKTAATRYFDVDEIVHMKSSSLDDPYTEGIGPLEAMLTRVRIERQYNRQSEAWLANRARPDGIIHPSGAEDVLTKDDRERMERMWNMKYRDSGSGQIHVMQSAAIKFTPLTFSPKDMGELADLRVSIDQIARAFDIPLSMLNKDANRASAEEGRQQHAKDAVIPRLCRIEDAINEIAEEMYGDDVFFAFDNPVSEDREFEMKDRESKLKTGQRTINEYRMEDGCEEVEWGDRPWLPTSSAQPKTEEEKERDRELAEQISSGDADDEPDDKPEDDSDKDDGKAADKAFRMALAKLSTKQLATYVECRRRLKANGNLPVDWTC